MLDIKTQMCELSKKRKVFHSEADFQFALAWQIQKSYPKANIRLEYCPKEFANMHLDILVELDGKNYPIELKYKTNKLSIDLDGESYNLKTHAATSLVRYDVLFDVYRIESLKRELNEYEKGYTIFLTNVKSNWEEPKTSRKAMSQNFLIHNMQIIGGEIDWSNNPSEGSTGSRERFELEGKYTMVWSNYSELDKKKNNIFKYLLLEI